MQALRMNAQTAFAAFFLYLLWDNPAKANDTFTAKTITQTVFISRAVFGLWDTKCEHAKCWKKMTPGECFLFLEKCILVFFVLVSFFVSVTKL